MRVLNTFSYKYQIAFIAIKLLLFHVAGSRDRAAQGKYFCHLFFMCVLNVFNFTNVKLHLLRRNCSWLPQSSCDIKLFCFMSLAPLIQLPQTEKSENLIKTELPLAE